MVNFGRLRETWPGRVGRGGRSWGVWPGRTRLGWAPLQPGQLISQRSLQHISGCIGLEPGQGATQQPRPPEVGPPGQAGHPAAEGAPLTLLLGQDKSLQIPGWDRHVIHNSLFPSGCLVASVGLSPGWHSGSGGGTGLAPCEPIDSLPAGPQNKSGEKRLPPLQGAHMRMMESPTT